MKLYTDHAFHIGKPHLTGGTPCQDYALSGLCGDAAYAIVSDGCSSGRETDVGARLVAHAMKMELCEKGSTIKTLAGIQARLPTASNMWGFEEQDLLATCVSAYITDGFVRIRMFGDGVFAFKFKNGAVDMHQYEWNKNAPFYPAYWTHKAFDAFVAFHSDEPHPLLGRRALFRLDGTVVRNVKAHSISEGVYDLQARLTPWELRHHDGLEYVAVFTDGITQVDGLSWEDAVRQLLLFKTIEGSFAKRRLMRVVKDAEKNGRGCLDDIAYAVIRIGGDDEQKS